MLSSTPSASTSSLQLQSQSFLLQLCVALWLDRDSYVLVAVACSVVDGRLNVNTTPREAFFSRLVALIRPSLFFSLSILFFSFVSTLSSLLLQLFVSAPMQTLLLVSGFSYLKIRRFVMIPCSMSSLMLPLSLLHPFICHRIRSLHTSMVLALMFVIVRRSSSLLAVVLLSGAFAVESSELKYLSLTAILVLSLV